jgi:hypothetical protein
MVNGPRSNARNVVYAGNFLLVRKEGKDAIMEPHR